jgi:hypothetical protein
MKFGLSSMKTLIVKNKNPPSNPVIKQLACGIQEPVMNL